MSKLMTVMKSACFFREIQLELRKYCITSMCVTLSMHGGTSCFDEEITSRARIITIFVV